VTREECHPGARRAGSGEGARATSRLFGARGGSVAGFGLRERLKHPDRRASNHEHGHDGQKHRDKENEEEEALRGLLGLAPIRDHAFAGRMDHTFHGLALRSGRRIPWVIDRPSRVLNPVATAFSKCRAAGAPYPRQPFGQVLSPQQTLPNERSPAVGLHAAQISTNSEEFGTSPLTFRSSISVYLLVANALTRPPCAGTRLARGNGRGN
jgi:hypothetical protein